MVDRRRLARLKAAMQGETIAIEQEDGSVEFFAETPALLLEFMAAEWAEGAAEYHGEEYTWEGETARLRRALDNATDASREWFYSEYTPAGQWAEDVRQREMEE